MWSLHLFEEHNTFERYFDGKMDGWTVEHWIESIDAISPEDGRYGQMHDPRLTHEFFFFF